MAEPNGAIYVKTNPPKGRRRKGIKVQNAFEKILLKWGYQVHNQKPVATLIQIPKRGYYSKPSYRPEDRIIKREDKTELMWISRRNDIFGCIDIVAIKPGEKTLWVQVTADRGVLRKLKKISYIDWNFEHSEVWIAIYIGKGKWDIHKVCRDEKGQITYKSYGKIIYSKLYKLERGQNERKNRR